jgi:NADH-quinone oxidoreductase subunit J
MLNEIAFYLIAAVTLGFAVAAMTLRQLIHGALCAAAAFAGLAMLYLQLEADFVGFAQLLVYVGAIAILIVFAVLLTRADETLPGSRRASPSWLMGIAAALLVLSGIALPILSSPSLRHGPTAPAAAPVKLIGVELMTHYVLPLEMVGVLLTAALLGAVVIAMREEPETEVQSRPPAARRVETPEVVSQP